MNKELIQTAFSWDSHNWSQALRLWNPVLQNPVPLSVLEIGGREGGLSLLAASMGHNVLCTDTFNPEEIAKPIHTSFGVDERIRYASLNALDIPYTDEFDVIIFKSVLGGIGYGDRKDLQVRAISEMWKALRPGGHLLFAENLRGTWLHQKLRRTQKWGSTWRYVSRNEMLDFCHSFSEYTCNTTGVFGVFGRSEMQRGILGQVDQSLLGKCFPASWHYILFGAARK